MVACTGPICGWSVLSMSRMCTYDCLCYLRTKCKGPFWQLPWSLQLSVPAVVLQCCTWCRLPIFNCPCCCCRRLAAPATLGAFAAWLHCCSAHQHARKQHEHHQDKSCLDRLVWLPAKRFHIDVMLEGSTPLMLAVRACNINLAKALLAAGADPLAVCTPSSSGAEGSGGEWTTPLHQGEPGAGWNGVDQQWTGGSRHSVSGQGSHWLNPHWCTCNLSCEHRHTGTRWLSQPTVCQPGKRTHGMSTCAVVQANTVSQRAVLTGMHSPLG